MPRRSERHGLAAWLGLMAIAIQAFVPLLVAGEISLAASGADTAIFDQCPFYQDAGGAPGTAEHHHGHGGLCPICLALLASPAFTQPATVPLPLPVATAVAVRPAETPLAARPALRVAYRSRAPPLV